MCTEPYALTISRLQVDAGWQCTQQLGGTQLSGPEGRVVIAQYQHAHSVAYTGQERCGWAKHGWSYTATACSRMRSAVGWSCAEANVGDRQRHPGFIGMNPRTVVCVQQICG